MHQTTRECKHPACSCQTDEGKDYCSQYCEDAANTTEISCNCGHAGCAITAAEPAMTA
jgi:hypothetical protein